MATYISALPVGTVVHGPERDYRIVRVLGQGGFGITYLVEGDVVVGNITATVRFALKEHFISQICDRDETTRRVIHSKAATETVDRSLKSFVKESRRLHNLGVDHPNIVKINEVFEANGTAYYVMQYLEGETLTAYVGRVGAMSADETMFFMRPLIEAVADLHDARLTHYDIKPDNIILSRGKDGVVRAVLIDFGLAKHYDRSGQATSTVATSGYTPGYAPMEQYAGLSDFSPQTDVYSLAATIYFCLTGHTPAEAFAFAPESIADDFGANVPAAITAAVTHAMQLKRDQRPADARALLQELDGVAPSPASVDTVVRPRPRMNETTEEQKTPEKAESRVSKKIVYAGLLATAIIIGLLALFISKSDSDIDNKSDVIENAALPSANPENVTNRPAGFRVDPYLFDLCVSKKGRIYYFSQEEWAGLPDKSGFEKLGVYLGHNGLNFLVDLQDSGDKMTWDAAMSMYGDRLPSKEQARVIFDNRQELAAAINSFGGNMEPDWQYWTKDTDKQASYDYAHTFDAKSGTEYSYIKTHALKARGVSPVPQGVQSNVAL